MERPRQKGHGDYATNVALQLGQEGRAPTRVRWASCWPRGCASADGIGAVEVAGPGFLNITVEAGAQGQVAADVVAAGAAYGHTEALAGQRINVEFISANPTGPLHLGHTRWAAVGDAIGRVLAAAGAEVTPGVLHQRPRRPDGPVRRLAGGRGAGPARSRTTATTATTSTTSPTGGRGSDPAILDLPAEERVVAFRRGRLRAAARASSRSSSTHFRHPLRRVVLRARRCTRTARSPRTSSSCAARGTSSRRTARCGCARPTSVTTRTGC